MSLAQKVIVFISIIILVTKASTQRTQSYDPCLRNDQCKENSYCHISRSTDSGKCKCKDGYKINRNKTSYECLPVKKVGEPCEANSQCQLSDSQELAICESKRCACNLESYNWNGICYLKSKLGEICMENRNCYTEDGSLNGSNAVCSESYCECQPGQVRSHDNTLCIKTKKLGETCYLDDECALRDTKTQCLNVCVCDSKHTESQNGTECVEVADEFGSPCDFDGQCSKRLARSICKEGRCGCLDDSHEYQNQCVRTRKRGESCYEHAECFYGEPNLKCLQGSCQCPNGEVCEIQNVIGFKENNNSATKTTSFIVFVLLALFDRLC